MPASDTPAPPAPAGRGRRPRGHARPRRRAVPARDGPRGPAAGGSRCSAAAGLPAMLAPAHPLLPAEPGRRGCHRGSPPATWRRSSTPAGWRPRRVLAVPGRPGQPPARCRGRYDEGAAAARRRGRRGTGRRRVHRGRRGGRRSPTWATSPPACSGWSSIGARHLRHRLTCSNGRTAAAEDRPQPYAEATRLLTQLRGGGPAAARRHARPGRHRRAPARGAAHRGPRRPGRGALRQRRRPAGRAGPDRRRPGRLGDLAGRRLRHRRRLGEPAAADGRPLAGPLAPRRRGLRAGGARWWPGSARSGW